MTLKIYGISASRAARPLWVALELGVPFEHIAMTYKAGATRTPEFLALNPNGHNPVVVDERPEGTVTVRESMACALYMAHLAANRFTVADVCVAIVANWIRAAPGLLAQYPAVSDWLHLHGARGAQARAGVALRTLPAGYVFKIAPAPASSTPATACAAA